MSTTIIKQEDGTYKQIVTYNRMGTVVTEETSLEVESALNRTKAIQTELMALIETKRAELAKINDTIVILEPVVAQVLADKAQEALEKARLAAEEASAVAQGATIV